ncbi:hypothetical protein EBT16_00235 [bacterium]|nr:hypothetical protein [bacterium]
MSLCIESDIDDEDVAEFQEVGADRQFLDHTVSRYIENYFRDKAVPEGVDLFSPKYINMCLTMDICRAADMAYEAIARCGLMGEDSGDNAIEPDVKLVIGILRRMKPLVPQEFSAGMLLMHLEILEGVVF